MCLAARIRTTVLQPEMDNSYSVEYNGSAVLSPQLPLPPRDHASILSTPPYLESVRLHVHIRYGQVVANEEDVVRRYAVRSQQRPGGLAVVRPYGARDEGRVAGGVVGVRVSHGSGRFGGTAYGTRHTGLSAIAFEQFFVGSAGPASQTHARYPQRPPPASLRPRLVAPCLKLPASTPRPALSRRQCMPLLHLLGLTRKRVRATPPQHPPCPLPSAASPSTLPAANAARLRLHSSALRPPLPPSLSPSQPHRPHRHP